MQQQNLKELMSESKNIVVLTGAGVSTDSGIPDFQESDEAWPYEVPREVAISLPFFLKKPRRFWQIYREVFGSKFTAEPNDFHRYLADLQADHKVTIVTQNVDGLHRKAGSENVIEVHGNLNYVVCMSPNCDFKYPAAIFKLEEVPFCIRCEQPLKPDVCLFYENVSGIDEALKALKDSDLFITAGTSLQVGPVNELPLVAERNYPQDRLWINRDKVPYGYNFRYQFVGEMSDFLKEVK